MAVIAKKLNNLKILTPAGKNNWSSVTIRSILTNEKYKGDAIINKTFVVDCISKQVKINNGERKKYYVKNNHPAILFFVKLGTAYFDYRKHGQFEFVAPCILFACLVFTLTAPLYIWDIIG